MVDQVWSNKDSGLLAYSLALLNNVAFNVVEFAKSQIDWMSEKLMNMFREKRSNPFQFRHLKLCHSMAEVNKVPAPKVVLASMPDMECGFARELFLQWCTNPKNSVILTSRSSPGTLARQLIAHQGDRDRVIPLEVRRRIKLTGAELEDYRQKEKEKEKKNVSSLVEAALDEESDSEDEMEVSFTKAGDKSKLVKHDIVMKPDSIKKQSGFFKSNKSRYPMYPCHEEKIKYDDYGEIIRPEDFMDTSEPVNNLDSHVLHHQEEENMAVQVVHGLRGVHEILWPDYLSIVVILDLFLVARVHGVSRLIRLEEARLLLDGVRLHHNVMLHQLRLVPSLGEAYFHF